jgi:hypothetical protein
MNYPEKQDWIMNVQRDLFDDDFGRDQRELKDKMEILATGKWSRGLKGKKLTEAYDKKVSELLGDED